MTHTAVLTQSLILALQGMHAQVLLLVHKDDVATVIREDAALAPLHAQL